MMQLTNEEITLSDIQEGLTAPVDIKKLSLQEIKEWLAQALPNTTNVLFKVVIAIVILLIGIKIIGFVRKLLRKSLTKAGIDKGVATFLDSVIRIALYVVLLLMILNQFGVQTTSIVAVIGSAGLAVGLALQGSMANFAGGVLILVLKPFKVGDYIIEDTNKNEGYVTEISIFYTHLRTVDNRIIVVPNGTLANTSLTNTTLQDKRMIDLRVGIAYDADLKKAKKVIEEVLLNETQRCMGEDVKVFVAELAESSVQIGVRMWVYTEDYWEVKWRITENIKLSLDDNNIPIPFQQLDVHIRQ